MGKNRQKKQKAYKNIKMETNFCNTRASTDKTNENVTVETNLHQTFATHGQKIIVVSNLLQILNNSKIMVVPNWGAQLAEGDVSAPTITQGHPGQPDTSPND